MTDSGRKSLANDRLHNSSLPLAVRGGGVRCEMKGTHLKQTLVMIVALLVIVLSGCAPNDFLRNIMHRMAPDDDEALAKECLSALRAGDFQAVTRQLDPQFVKPGIESNLAQVARTLAHGDPVSLELVGCNVFSTPGKRRSNLTYQYQFTNAWVLAAVMIDTVGENKKVFGVNVNPIPKSLGELNAFTLTGKGARHYVLLVAAIILPLFIIWTTVLCARTRLRTKWLWIIFILIGITKLNLNWTTGQMGFQPLGFQIPGAGVMKMGLYAPWILTVSFPLGAILFLVKRRKLRATENREPESTEPPAAPSSEPATRSPQG
jgi:hypothetical protein